MNETETTESKDNSENGSERQLTRKELRAWATKIIADARPKNHKEKRVTKKNRMSRKEYIESLAMRDKWWSHYGRGPWY